MELHEELQSIEAIFCNPNDEFFVDVEGWQNGTHTVFSVKMCYQDTTKEVLKVKCILTLPPDYPLLPPTVAFSSTQIPNSSLSLFKEDVKAFIDTLGQSAMLLDLLLWIKDNLQAYILSSDDKSVTPKDTDTKQLVNAEDESNVITILKLDHMRAKTKYLKTLERWSGELDVAVAVLFKNNQIIVILQGKKANVKEYVIRQKTTNIDVDSKGRSCKERLLTILTEIRCTKNQSRLQSFQTRSFDTSMAMEDFFREIGLKDHFDIVR